MPAFHAHDDDFLFQIQYSPADKEPKESPKSPADEMLERFSRRLRRTGFNLTLSASYPPKLCVNRFGKSFWRSISPSGQ